MKIFVTTHPSGLRQRVEVNNPTGEFVLGPNDVANSPKYDASEIYESLKLIEDLSSEHVISQFLVCGHVRREERRKRIPSECVPIATSISQCE